MGWRHSAARLLPIIFVRLGCSGGGVDTPAAPAALPGTLSPPCLGVCGAALSAYIHPRAARKQAFRHVTARPPARALREKRVIGLTRLHAQQPGTRFSISVTTKATCTGMFAEIPCHGLLGDAPPTAMPLQKPRIAGAARAPVRFAALAKPVLAGCTPHQPGGLLDCK